MDTITKNQAAVLAVIMLFIGALGAGYVSNNDYICTDSMTVLHCEGGISGGGHTRCYTTAEKNTWKTCSGGWEDINNYLEENQVDIVVPDTPEGETQIKVNANGKEYTCNDNVFSRKTKCCSGSECVEFGELL